MKDLGKGLATCGIWAAVAVVGWQMPTAAIIPAFLACFATGSVWSR